MRRSATLGVAPILTYRVYVMKKKTRTGHTGIGFVPQGTGRQQYPKKRNTSSVVRLQQMRPQRRPHYPPSVTAQHRHKNMRFHACARRLRKPSLLGRTDCSWLLVRFRLHRSLSHRAPPLTNGTLFPFRLTTGMLASSVGDGICWAWHKLAASHTTRVSTRAHCVAPLSRLTAAWVTDSVWLARWVRIACPASCG